MSILAGDIGGTKTVLGLFKSGRSRPEIIHSRTYSSRAYESLESMITEFLADHNEHVETACFGVPGPVLEGECRTTNLNWVVSSKNLQHRLGTTRVTLVNDLVATALAAPTLEVDEYTVLNPGKQYEDGALGVVAPGTGLGMALMIWTDSSYHPVPSEGGHVDFAPTDNMQVSLLQHMMKRFTRVSVERVASGPGLLEIYNWLAFEKGQVGGPLYKEINSSANPSEIITGHALEMKDPLCDNALDIYVSILGSVCGNLALTAMTTRGMFLGGGVSPKILPKLVDGKFFEAFTNKGRFSELTHSIPLKIILNDRAALVGASIRGAQSL